MDTRSREAMFAPSGSVFRRKVDALYGYPSYKHSHTRILLRVGVGEKSMYKELYRYEMLVPKQDLPDRVEKVPVTSLPTKRC